MHDAALTAGDNEVSDKAVGHVYRDDGAALPALGSNLARYGNWASVASTIYNKMYRIAGFDPSIRDYDASSYAKLQYLFSSSPFWNVQFSSLSGEAAIQPNNFKPALNMIGGFASTVDIDLETEKLIVQNIKRIVQLASQSDDAARKQSIFYNGTIAVTMGNVHILAIHAAVTTELDRLRGKYRAVTQSLNIVLAHGVLDIDFCKRHWNNIIGYGQYSIEEWQAQAVANDQPENRSEGWPPVKAQLPAKSQPKDTVPKSSAGTTST